MTEASEKKIRAQKENPSDFVCLPDCGRHASFPPVLGMKGIIPYSVDLEKSFNKLAWIYPDRMERESIVPDSDASEGNGTAYRRCRSDRISLEPSPDSGWQSIENKKNTRDIAQSLESLLSEI